MRVQISVWGFALASAFHVRSQSIREAREHSRWDPPADAKLCMFDHFIPGCSDRFNVYHAWKFFLSSLNVRRCMFSVLCVVCLKKNQNAPRPSEHPPVRGENMSKRLGGIKGCKNTEPVV